MSRTEAGNLMSGAATLLRPPAEISGDPRTV